MSRDSDAKAMVVSSEVTAVDAGVRVLNQGGNAIDAAVATAACLSVTEPCCNGIGGDAFALIWDGEGLHGLNASGRSPAAWSPKRFANLNEMPKRGWESVTVPGQIAGWRALLERFGSQSMATCLAPAIEAAEQGFVVSAKIAKSWSRGIQVFADNPDFVAAFADGGPPQAGTIRRLPDHGHTLRLIAESNGDDFYHGDLAHKIILAARTAGAGMELDDLQRCQADWVEPLALKAAGITGYELPPNGQGIAALAACGVADFLELDRYGADDPQAIHLQIEAIKQAFADLYSDVADPKAMFIDPNDLLASTRLESQAARIKPDRAGPMNTPLPPSSGTVLLATADNQGRMVALIQSNYMGFGSGIVIPGTGIALQNRGAGFVLTPGHPNQVGPRKRPFHTIIPGFWMRDQQPLGPFGCMGGVMQAQGHLQLWQRIFRWGQEPQAAIDAKRWQLSKAGVVLTEEGFSKQTIKHLRACGHEVRESQDPLWFGGAQIILRNSDGFLSGATDLRKDGKVGIAQED